MADLHTRWRHGIRAMCAMVEGHSVARHLKIISADELCEWLEARPEWLDELWNAMEDEEEHECDAVTNSVVHREHYTPQTGGN